MLNSVSVFGIGKLGLPLAASLANRGYHVIGVDTNPEVVTAVNEGKSPYYEPGLSELITSARDHLEATSDYSYAVQNSSIHFILVPTPSEPDGTFSTKYVEVVAQRIAVDLKNRPDFHLVVLTSTVLPGATEGVVQKMLERGSGKKCSRDFGLCYSPEFVALGSVIRDFTNPDVVLIGESDTKSGDILAGIYREVCQNHPPIIRTSIYNAELAKISLNAFVTMKITFANTLAEIAEKIPGGDAGVISQMLGYDSRIGRKYLTGGLAFGGPCFPRDNQAFCSFARRLGVQAKLSLATDEVNREQVERVAGLAYQELGQASGKRVAILGLTYKPDTDVIEESAAVKIALKFRERGVGLSVYDPAGMENAKKVLGDNEVRYTASPGDCLKGTDLCILATPWKQFRSLTPEDFTVQMRTPVLLDCWRFFDRTKFSPVVTYLAIGLSRRS